MMGRLKRLRGRFCRLSEAKSLKISLFGMDQYYPFGMRMPVPNLHLPSQQTSGGGLSYNSGTENRYRYNGKEYHQELGLGLYDYGARMYDPAIGRWNGVDALANIYDRFSPFNYVLNNPITLIDPDGYSVSTAQLISNAWIATPNGQNIRFSVPENINSNENNSPDPPVANALRLEGYFNAFFYTEAQFGPPGSFGFIRIPVMGKGMESSRSYDVVNGTSSKEITLPETYPSDFLIGVGSDELASFGWYPNNNIFRLLIVEPRLYVGHPKFSRAQYDFTYNFKTGEFQVGMRANYTFTPWNISKKFGSAKGEYFRPIPGFQVNAGVRATSSWSAVKKYGQITLATLRNNIYTLPQRINRLIESIKHATTGNAPEPSNEY